MAELNGCTPEQKQWPLDDTLGEAARRGNLKIVQAILAECKDWRLEQRLEILNGRQGYAANGALMMAAMHGHIKIVQVLLAELKDCSLEQKLAIVNNRITCGNTALNWAVSHAHTEIGQAILVELEDCAVKQTPSPAPILFRDKEKASDIVLEQKKADKEDALSSEMQEKCTI